MRKQKHNCPPPLIPSNLTLEIEQDTDASPPSDWEDASIMRFWSNTPRHLGSINTKQKMEIFLPDGGPLDLGRAEELSGLTKADGWHFFPVFAYIHSGIALSLAREGQFADRWDSGLAGVLAVNTDTVGAPDARALAAGIIEEWNMYLAGDVWGYTVRDEEGEVLDSCWGMYGREYAEGEGKAALEHQQEKEAEEAARYANMC